MGIITDDHPYAIFIKTGWLESVTLSIHKLNADCNAFQNRGEAPGIIGVLELDTDIASRICSDLMLAKSKMESMTIMMVRILETAIGEARNIIARSIPLIDNDYNSPRTIESIICDLNDRDEMVVQNPDLYYEIQFNTPYDVKITEKDMSSYTFLKICKTKLPEIEDICKQIIVLMDNHINKFNNALNEDMVNLTKSVSDGVELPESLTPFLPSEEWLMKIDQNIKMFSNLINAIYHNLEICNAVINVAVRNIMEHQ